jgi:hypothetical protein
MLIYGQPEGVPSRRLRAPCHFARRSGVYGFAQKDMGSFHPGFGQGGMGVDRVGKIRGRQFRTDRDRGFRDQVGGVGSDGVRSQQLICLRIRHPLHKTDGLADGQRFAQRPIRYFPVLIFLPCRWASCSPRPTVPISGVVKIQLGTTVSFLCR